MSTMSTMSMMMVVMTMMTTMLTCQQWWLHMCGSGEARCQGTWAWLVMMMFIIIIINNIIIIRSIMMTVMMVTMGKKERLKADIWKKTRTCWHRIEIIIRFERILNQHLINSIVWVPFNSSPFWENPQLGICKNSSLIHSTHPSTKAPASLSHPIPSLNKSKAETLQGYLPRELVMVMVTVMIMMMMMVMIMMMMVMMIYFKEICQGNWWGSASCPPTEKGDFLATTLLILFPTAANWNILLILFSTKIWKGNFLADSIFYKNINVLIKRSRNRMTKQKNLKVKYFYRSEGTAANYVQGHRPNVMKNNPLIAKLP